MGENLTKAEKFIHMRLNGSGYLITNKETDSISYSSVV